jgi:hypothetical protein
VEKEFLRLRLLSEITALGVSNGAHSLHLQALFRRLIARVFKMVERRERLAIIMKTTSDNERHRNVLSSTHFSPSFASLSDE